MKTILAIAATALFAASAGHAAAQEAEPRSISVSYADLDLTRSSGREALEQRVANAVALVCSPRPAIVDLAQSHEYGKCRAHAITGARQQLAQLYSGRVLAQASIAVGPGKR